jgi:diacylglycerol kinase family enzyme
VLVANTRYSGRVLDASLRPRLDEGRLWLYTTRARGRADFLRLVWQTLVRQIDAADALHSGSATEAVIITEPARLPAAADGEVIELTSPLRFRIRPGALQVLAPPRTDPT